MVLSCKRQSCVDGNCPGCQGGKRWCDDPRCSPYCTGCKPPKQNFEVVNMLFFLFLVILLIGVAVSLYFYGPRWTVHHPGTYDPEMEIIDGPMVL
jgi:hypothetical protein